MHGGFACRMEKVLASDFFLRFTAPHRRTASSPGFALLLTPDDNTAAVPGSLLSADDLPVEPERQRPACSVVDVL